MADGFLIRAALAGVGLSLATGPLGAMVLWRRMAQFGDATAHAAVLGVALALAAGLPAGLGTLAVAVATALAVAGLTARGWAPETTLAVMAHGMLALGLVAAALVPGARMNLEAVLFGDILAVGPAEVAAIWAGAVAVVAVLAWRWSALLTATLSPDLAHAAGLHPGRERVMLVLALAVTVALAIPVVGALLVGAMLIVPAAAARGLARGPEGMAAAASAIGAGSVLAGLALSLAADTPAGPSIVAVAMAAFAAVAALRAARGG